MRLGRHQYLPRRSRADKFLQHAPPNILGVLDPGIQFAVGERASPTLAELHIALRAQHRFPPQRERIDRALPHDLPTLQNNRPEPHLRERQGRKQPARPRPDHHRPCKPCGRRPRHQPVPHFGCEPERAAIPHAAPAQPPRRLVPHPACKPGRSHRAVVHPPRAGKPAASVPSHPPHPAAHMSRLANACGGWSSGSLISVRRSMEMCRVEGRSRGLCPRPAK